MKKIMVVAILAALIATGCASNQNQFRSNVHSGNVPEWVIPASLSPAFEKDGKVIAVGFCARMYDVEKQREEAAKIAIFKIQKYCGNQEATFRIQNVFIDREENIFVVAEYRPEK